MEPSANPFPMHVGIVVTSAAQLAAVYALLGSGVSTVAVAAAAPEPIAGKETPVANTATTETATASDASESSSEAEVDSAGVPFDPEIHTGTKLKDGTWRAKKGMADKAAELKEAATDEEPTAEEPAAEPVEEDDEFAAFRDAADTAEPEPAPRKWTEADISKLCNQAAVKLGDPGPIKNIIAKYVPEGETPHSRNIPEASREAFAQEVESKAGIEYDG